MAASHEPPDKTVVIGALVLAFSNSEARALVGTDALRGVLEVEYHDIVRDGKFDAEQVWDLLESQPGFTAELVTPPLCLFKSWQDKLNLEVVLPDQLAGLSDKEMALEAAKCPVGPSELQRILRTGERKPAAPSPAAAPVRDLTPDERPSRRSHPAFLAAASVVALVCFVFAGYHLRAGCAGPAWRDASAADFADIPVESARRLGAEVGGRLSNADWLALPRETREEQLKQVLRRLEPKEIHTVFVESPAGKVVASAQFFDGARDQIRVRFY